MGVVLMNEELIKRLVEPYLKNNKLSYDDFDKVFGRLKLKPKEQYAIVNVLDKLSIELYEPDNVESNDSAVLSDELSNSALTDDSDNGDCGEIIDVSDEKIVDDDGTVITDEVITNYFNEKYKDDVKVSRNIAQSNENLCILIQSGNEKAANDLCIKNKRLVFKYAYYYYKKIRCKLDLEDLIQVGSMGMLKAANKFNPKLGYAFTTYAVSWIKQAILRTIADEGYTIRVPVHMFEKILQIKREYNRIDDGNLSESEIIDRIADNLSLSRDDVVNAFTVDRNFISTSSLDTPIGETGENVLGDMIVDNMILPPEEMCTMKLLHEDLLKLLDVLKPREKRVIILRFGLFDGIPRTLEEVGRMMGVTRERIRQIEEKALRILRRSSYSRKLEGYLD